MTMNQIGEGKREDRYRWLYELQGDCLISFAILCIHKKGKKGTRYYPLWTFPSGFPLKILKRVY